MLKSVNKIKTSIKTMNLSQKISLICNRFYSNAKNVAFLRQWNYDNKKLFGNVKKKTGKKGSQPESVKKIENDANNWDTTSERHWIIKGTNTKTIRLKESVKMSKEIHQDFSQLIPFNDPSLKGLLNYPLIHDSVSQITTEPVQDIVIPSVGRVLQATMSDSARNALQKWKLLKIEELGEEGFQQLQKSYLEKGLNFHRYLQNYFTLGQRPDQNSKDFKVWESVSPILDKLDQKATFVEQPLYHPVLKYKGVVDCVTKNNDELVIVEWKNSDRSKGNISSTYDAPVQLCAYLGALNCNSKYNVQIRRGLVVVAYQSGRPADCFTLQESELRKYWTAWLLRLQYSGSEFATKLCLNRFSIKCVHNVVANNNS